MPPNVRLHPGAPADGDAIPRDERLRAALRDVYEDHEATSRELVLRAAEALREWVLAADESWSWTEAGEALERELAPVLTAHDWRGTVAFWIDSVRRAVHAGRERAPHDARTAIAEELGLWLWSPDDVPGLAECTREWNGEPSSLGRRLPRREDCAKAAAASLERGEIVLVNGYSETVVLALVEAWRLGKQPSALIAEGLPHLDGRRMARSLVRQGVEVTLCYDAALVARVPSADRVWLGSETLGVAGFLGRVGTTVLLEECERQGVLAALLATSDELVPGGDVRVPEWPERSPWLLWDDEPAGVRLESQYLEIVSHALVGELFTERGAESFPALALRCLRTEPAARCDRWQSTAAAAAASSTSRVLAP